MACHNKVFWFFPPTITVQRRSGGPPEAWSSAIWDAWPAQRGREG